MDNALEIKGLCKQYEGFALENHRDCGCLLLDIPGYRQPAELFLCKELPRG